MRRRIAMCLCLIALSGLSRAAAVDNVDEKAPDKATEIARLVGEYTAEFSTRTGQAPADSRVLKGLTLKVTKEEWIQTFFGDVAPYTIALDLTDGLKALQLTHKQVKVVRNCVYVLKDDTLTVTEDLGPDVGTAVTIWKRKPVRVN